MGNITESEISRRQEHAIELRGTGYNCAQCVLMTLSDNLGIDEATAAKLTAAFGSGFGASGEICGALSSLGVAVGLAQDDSAPTAKIQAMKTTKQMVDSFRDGNQGRVRCCELKGKKDARSCPDLIRQAVEIYLKNDSI
ncbi:MAG: C_GCAxxG_C_C family protein [Bacteroides sp.]|nr:C_GCAxxG_C_C family protein [Bacteroides sp.]